MQGKRTERVSHLIQMELSQLILHRVKDPRVGFVTVTHVDVTPDLREARVYYSVFGDEKSKKGTQTALEKAAGFLQRELGTIIKLRLTPKLQFVVDDTIERSIEIEKVVREIHKDDGPQAS